MAPSTNFASQIDSEVLAELQAYANEEGRSVSSVLNESVAEYLAKRRIRPSFRSVADEVLDEHAELLAKLAR